MKLSAYNVFGLKVASLIDGVGHDGDKLVKFKANNLPGGIYLYRVKTVFFTDVGRMMLVR